MKTVHHFTQLSLELNLSLQWLNTFLKVSPHLLYAVLCAAQHCLYISLCIVLVYCISFAYHLATPPHSMHLLTCYLVSHDRHYLVLFCKWTCAISPMNSWPCLLMLHGLLLCSIPTSYCSWFVLLMLVIDYQVHRLVWPLALMCSVVVEHLAFWLGVLQSPLALSTLLVYLAEAVDFSCQPEVI